VKTKAQYVHSHLTLKASEVQTAIKSKRPVSHAAAELTYYIFEGVLVGFIDSELIHVIAWSGGAGGSTRESAPDGQVANNPYMYAKKAIGKPRNPNHVHGGPIPPGSYRVYPPAMHKTLGLSCFLKPLQKLPNNRGEFFIHKQGPHGSDGCIVPAADAFEALMQKLKRSGGGHLKVYEAVDGAFA
jgi:hypothetical protein